MNFKERESAEKLRGGYYTPEDPASFLVRWIARKSPERILEPSCGDGAFFGPLARFCQASKIDAFEINEDEAEKAEQRAENLNLRNLKVHVEDFLGWALGVMETGGDRHDAIVGNPPFVRYQYLPEPFQQCAEAIFDTLSCNFTKHTNAWVSLVLACFELHKPGGRLARSSLPKSFMSCMHNRYEPTWANRQAASWWWTRRNCGSKTRFKARCCCWRKRKPALKNIPKAWAYTPYVTANSCFWTLKTSSPPRKRSTVEPSRENGPVRCCSPRHATFLTNCSARDWPTLSTMSRKSMSA